MSDQGTGIRKRKVSWGAVVGIGVVALLVIVVVSFLFSGSRSGARVEAALKELVAKGYSLDPASLNREVDPAVNGWEFGKSAIMAKIDWQMIGDWEFLTGGSSRLTHLSHTEYGGVLSADAVDTSAAIAQHGGGWGPEIPFITKADYEAELARARKEAAVVEQAVRMPDWAIHRDYSQPTMTLMPEYAPLKDWCKAFSDWGIAHFQRGEFEEGLRDFETSFLIGSHAGRNPFVLGMLVQVGCHSITVAQIVTAVEQFSAEDRIAVIPRVRELIRSRRPVDFAEAMRGDVLYGIDMPMHLDETIEESEWYVKFLPINRQAILTFHWESTRDAAEIVATFEEDPVRAWKELEVIDEREFRGNPIEKEVADYSPIGFYHGQTGASIIRMRERDRLVLLGLSIWEREARTGERVESLAELGEEDLTDAFHPSGGDYQFRRDQNGFVLWSYGENQVDDGGALDVDSDLYSEDIYFQTVHEGETVVSGR